MKRHLTHLIVLWFSLTLPLVTFSQAGTLDDTYGDNGTVVLSISTSHCSAWDMVTLPDTSTFIIGTMNSGSTSGFLVHMLSDGSQDMNFGDNGIVELQYGTSTYPYEMIRQDDGKIVVAGICYVTVSNSEFFIARFNPDGTPDLTFNSTGHFLSAYSTEEDNCEALARQSDGKYVMAGRTYLGSFSQLLFMRVNSDGTLDTSFGTSGYTEINASTQDERINAVDILSNGTIVGVGYGYQSTPFFGELLFMAKLTASGNPIPGFGTNGVIVPSLFDDISVAYDMVVSNDSLFVTGYMYDAANNQQLFVAKLDSTGTGSAGFGTNGISFLLVDPVTVGLEIMKTADGKLYISGTTGLGGPNNRDFLLVRYLSDGSLDASFDTDGYVTTDLQPAWDEANGLGLQPDGKIVLAGMSSGFPSLPNFIGMARYLNDYVPSGCYANFTVSDTLTCEGGQLTFTDQTISTDSTVVSWEWIFEGGTPSTSTVQNPVVTYMNAGEYAVTLMVYDGIYYDTLARTNYITVEAIPGTPTTPSGPSGLCGTYTGDYTNHSCNLC